MGPELDLRPQLERLDRLILRSERIDPGALTFAFRPLWRLDAPASAALALAKAQATQIYAGLGLWPAEVTARLAEAQLVADGTYPNAAAVFAEDRAAAPTSTSLTLDFNPAQPRDPDGRWTAGGSGTHAAEPVEVSTENHGPSDPVASPDPPFGESKAGQKGEGPHAPDGMPITPAAFKGGGRGMGRAIGALLGAASRVLRRWWPEEPDELPADSVPSVHDPAGSLPDPPIAAAQTDKNKKAQALDPRIRADLDDRFIKDDATLNWPMNDGVDGPETSLVLQPGQIVDKYGNVSGNYLSPQATPFSGRSLPYDMTRTPLRTFQVLKPIEVMRGRIAPWFDEPGGGIQLRMATDIENLAANGYLEYK